MTNHAWWVSGQFYEACSCDFVCRCLPPGRGEPTKGSCTFAMAFKVLSGTYGRSPLDGLGFIVVGVSPGIMSKGDWSVGLIVDERANGEQRNALTAIASGGAGGPMTAIWGLVGKFLGVEAAPVCFDRRGAHWRVTARDLVAIAGEVSDDTADAALRMNAGDVAHRGHMAADHFVSARASDSHVEAFGLSWHDASGGNNARWAPFFWRQS